MTEMIYRNTLLKEERNMRQKFTISKILRHRMFTVSKSTRINDDDVIHLIKVKVIFT